MGLRNPFVFRAGERNYQNSGKVQHIFNNVHSGSLRYAYSLGRVKDGVQGIENFSDYSARGSSRIADHGVVRTLSSAFKATLLKNLTFQYGRRDVRLTPNSREMFVEIPGVLSFGQGWRLDQQRNEQYFEVVDGLTLVAGGNTMSLGASVHDVRFDGRLANRFGGLTLYPTLADYRAGRVDFTIRALGRPDTAYSTTPLGFWINDRWQARRGITVEAGLRYDYQRMPAGLPASTRNIAPRFGLAWNPGGESKLVFRFGAELFFDRYPLAFLNEAIQKDGVNALEQYSYPGLNLNFRAAYRVSKNLPAAYGGKLTAGVERQLNADTTLAFEYSHVWGLHLPRIRNTAGGLPTAFLLEQNASSTFEGATVTLSRKMTSEFGYLLSYTGGRTNDDGSDYDEQAQNPLDLRQEWARSRQHQAYRVIATGLFEIEVLEKMSEKLSHIHIVPTFTFGSGRPLNVLQSSDAFRTGAFPLSARVGKRNSAFTPLGCVSRCACVQRNSLGREEDAFADGGRRLQLAEPLQSSAADRVCGVARPDNRVQPGTAATVVPPFRILMSREGVGISRYKRGKHEDPCGRWRDTTTDCADSAARSGQQTGLGFHECWRDGASLARFL